MKTGYLIDMDGVIYRGGTMISGATQFINRLIEEMIPFQFVTNNSQRTRRDISVKLQRLGVQADENHVYTCADATAEYLSLQSPNSTAYVIGEGGLLAALHDKGYAIVEKDPEFVVVGECRTFNAEMIEQALNHVVNGSKLIATNPDPNCPTATGTRPGCGAIVSVIEQASGRKAFSVGKPSPVMMRGARKNIALQASQTIMIGDTMNTDILGGVQLGYYTVLVLTGTTQREDLSNFAYQPARVVNSVADIDHDEMVGILQSRLMEYDFQDSEILV